MDGNFTIETDEPAPVLQFTYLGYKTMDMAAKEGHNVNAQMLPDSQALKEVVVTALGIKREKEDVGIFRTGCQGGCSQYDWRPFCDWCPRR